MSITVPLAAVDTIKDSKQGVSQPLPPPPPPTSLRLKICLVVEQFINNNNNNHKNNIDYQYWLS